MSADGAIELPATTVPATAQLIPLGFPQSADTDIFFDALCGFIIDLGRDLDLSLLDGVTVTWDLAEGFRSIDRGFDAPPITFTDTAQLRCVAKVIPVLREGAQKIHIVYNAPFVVSIADPDSPHYLEAKQILAHECGHLTESLWHLNAFPERGLGRGYPDTVAALLVGSAEVMWSEYATCRLTAQYGDVEALKLRYAQSLTDVAAVVAKDAEPAFQAFRLNRNVDDLLRAAGGVICEPLRMFGYLHGHLDGIDDKTPITDLCPTLPSEYIALWDAAGTELRRIWDSRGNWKGYFTTLEGLRGLAETAMNNAGIHFTPMPDGRTYVYLL